MDLALDRVQAGEKQCSGEWRPVGAGFPSLSCVECGSSRTRLGKGTFRPGLAAAFLKDCPQKQCERNPPIPELLKHYNKTAVSVPNPLETG